MAEATERLVACPPPPGLKKGKMAAGSAVASRGVLLLFLLIHVVQGSGEHHGVVTNRSTSDTEIPISASSGVC